MSKDYEDFSEFDNIFEEDDDDELDFGMAPVNNQSEQNESNRSSDESYNDSEEYYEDESSEEYYEDESSEEYYEDEQYEESYNQNEYSEDQNNDEYSQNDYDEEQYNYESKQLDSGYDTSDEGIDEEVNEDVPKPDMILYVVIDKYFDGMINYMRQSGLNVSCIFKSIADARDELLMQTEPYRLVVIETGLGRFTSTNQRKELIDLLGVCTDEDSRASVFYTDSVLKIDVTREIGKTPNIKWEKYKNTALTVARLIKLHENFILADEQSEDSLIVFDAVKDYIGLTSREQVSKGIQPIITSESILKGMMLTEEGTSLDEYYPEI